MEQAQLLQLLAELTFQLHRTQKLVDVLFAHNSDASVALLSLMKSVNDDAQKFVNDKLAPLLPKPELKEEPKVAV